MCGTLNIGYSHWGEQLALSHPTLRAPKNSTKRAPRRAKQPKRRSKTQGAVSRGITVKHAKPAITTKGGVVRISHKEYFGDITSGAVANVFEIAAYPMNPGISTLFPWLSQIAMRFDKYRFVSLRVLYEPRTSTTTSGVIHMAFDQDANDMPPDDSLEALSYEDSLTTPVWKEAALPIHLDGMYRFTRAGLPVNKVADLKTYDLGNLYTMNRGCPANQWMGSFSIAYTIELINPQVEDDVGGKFNAGDTVDISHPFASLTPVSSHTRVPFTINTTGTKATFTEPFEGALTSVLYGSELDGLTFATLKATVTELVSSILPDGSKLVKQYAIKSPAGGEIVPTVDGSTVTSAVYTLGKAAYDQLVA